MRFQIPQFIEMEVKLVGPFTLKQFLWIASGAAVLYLTFLLTNGGFWFFVIAVPVVGLAIALAYLKIDDVPLLNYIAYGLSYLTNPKQYIFKKDASFKPGGYT